MRISDWSSDVCSSDLLYVLSVGCSNRQTFSHLSPCHDTLTLMIHSLDGNCAISTAWIIPPAGRRVVSSRSRIGSYCRSEEHTSELQSLMRISYAVFCLKKKNKRQAPNRLTDICTQIKIVPTSYHA